ncbi:MAG: 1,4-dihydroxy-2-naphthoate octaprenyltransferase [Bacteroidota bacterium]
MSLPTPNSMTTIKAWLSAIRLRTLPLAAAVILLPSGILALQGLVQGSVVLHALWTAFLLQILSNLANDYGDAVSGADRHRIGPARMVASGQISVSAMRKAILGVAALALISGVWLLIPLADSGPAQAGGQGRFWGWLALGIAAVVAAIRYTVGSNPYGYRGLGEVAVLIFFGPVAYAGMRTLHGQNMALGDWGPALATGLLAASVLNLNNLRDREQDAQAGKITLAVRMGNRRALYFQSFLVMTAVVAMLVFAWSRSVPLLWGWSLMAVAYSNLLRKIWQVQEARNYDAFLKPTALYLLVMALMPWILHWRTM